MPLPEAIALPGVVLTDAWTRRPLHYPAHQALTRHRKYAMLFCGGEELVPRTEVILYAEFAGSCPVLEWLDRQEKKAQDKCIVRIERLAELGHELRRPEADLLEDGVYELRASHRRIHYRILYFFHEGAAVLAHGLVKEAKVPNADIERVKRRRDAYLASPQTHTYREPG